MAPSDSTVDLDEEYNRDCRELEGSQKAIKALGDLSTIVGSLPTVIDVNVMRQDLEDTLTMVAELREDLLNEMETGSIATYERAMESLIDVRRSLEDILEPDITRRKLRCRVNGCNAKVERGERWCAECKAKVAEAVALGART